MSNRNEAKQVLQSPAKIIREESLPSVADMQRWPIVRAYVPAREAWRVSGTGSAGIVRQQPDGRLITAFFTISLIQGGLEVIFGAEGATLAEIEGGVRNVGSDLPPTEPGPPQLAARFIWGAYAWSLADGQSWSRQLTSRYLGLVPRLPGTRLAWLDQFVGERGLVSSGLIAAIAQNPVPADLPASKEVAIATTMEFDLTGGAGAAIESIQRDEDFAELPAHRGMAHFHWLRASRHQPGRRTAYGTISIDRNRVIAQASTLSLAAMCLTKLAQTLGSRINLRDVKWSHPSTQTDRLPGAAPWH